MIQLFLDGCGQKWLWLFSSWDPKISCTLRMNFWIELGFFNVDSDAIVFD